jgi:DNA-directed RNA polymerase II subunit RPB2
LLPVCCSAAFLKERLFDQSDAYRVHVCEKSGLIAVANLKKQIFSSQIYKSDSQIVQVRFFDKLTHSLP